MKLIPIALALSLIPFSALSQDLSRGTVLYQDFCAVCHGATAEGDGPMAEVLSIAVPDLTQLSDEGEFPILSVARQIDGRDPLLAHGGPMPIFGDWFEGQGADVALPGPGGQPILLSRPIADLITYLQSMQS